MSIYRNASPRFPRPFPWLEFVAVLIERAFFGVLYAVSLCALAVALWSVIVPSNVVVDALITALLAR